jgi:hypothetical protein
MKREIDNSILIIVSALVGSQMSFYFGKYQIWENLGSFYGFIMFISVLIISIFSLAFILWLFRIIDNKLK